MGPRLGPQKAQQSAAHAAGKAQQQQQARALLAGHLSDEDTSEGSDVDSDLGSEGLDADAAAARPEDSDSGEEVDPRALALYERSRYCPCGATLLLCCGALLLSCRCAMTLVCRGLRLTLPGWSSP